MKVAVVGTGAVGLFYGIRLQGVGKSVHFLLRSGWEEARTQGLRVVTDAGTEVVAHPQCAREPEEIGVVDWVLIALKATENASWSRLLPPLLGPQTRLLTLQNGLGQEEALAAQFPGHPVYGGLCFVCLNRLSPATVRHFGHGSLLLGALESTFPATEGPLPGAALMDLAASWQGNGIPARTTRRLAEARWRKLIWNIPFNGLAITMGGITVDRILADPIGYERCLRLMTEVRDTANALGCDIEESFLEDQIDLTRSMDAYHPSSLLDFLAGRPLERVAIWEEPLRVAREKGLATPELARLVEEIRQEEAAAEPAKLR